MSMKTGRDGALVRRPLTRRVVLSVLGSGAIASLVAACGGAASPTAAPAKPTEAPKPAEPAKPAEVAKPTEAPKPAPAATTAPAAPTTAPTTAPAPAKPTEAPKPAAAGDPNKIVIVSSFPRQGTNKGQTDSAVNSIKMVLKEINNKIGTFTVEYRDMDDSSVAQNGNWDANVERANAQKAVEDPDVMVYIGTFNSGAAKVSIPILNQANLVMISPANTYPGLTKPGKGEANEPNVYYPTGKRNYARVVPADDLQGAVGAGWAKQLGAKKAYVLHDQQLYGKGIATVFADTTKKVGIDLAGNEGIDPQAQDYRSLANKIKASGADMVYYGGITGNNAAKLWKDLRAGLGANAIMMGPDGIFDSDFIKGAGDAALNTYVTFGGLPPAKLTGKGKEWYDAYKKEFTNEPEAYAVYTYEAAKVVVAAIQKVAKKDRDAIRQAVMTTKDWDGALGKWSFDDNGDTSNTDFSGSQAKQKDGKLDWDFVSTLQAPK